MSVKTWTSVKTQVFTVTGNRSVYDCPFAEGFVSLVCTESAGGWRRRSAIGPTFSQCRIDYFGLCHIF